MMVMASVSLMLLPGILDSRLDTWPPRWCGSVKPWATYPPFYIGAAVALLCAMIDRCCTAAAPLSMVVVLPLVCIQLLIAFGKSPVVIVGCIVVLVLQESNQRRHRRRKRALEEEPTNP